MVPEETFCRWVSLAECHHGGGGGGGFKSGTFLLSDVTYLRHISLVVSAMSHLKVRYLCALFVTPDATVDSKENKCRVLLERVLRFMFDNGHFIFAVVHIRLRLIC